MQLPDKFSRRIAEVFQEKGRKWLDSLDMIVNACIDKWKLQDCELAGGLSYNLICFARSAEFGAVVLKVGVPHSELFTEMTALRVYGGRGICRCYAADRELGAMLLERILPGTDLRERPTTAERTEIAADMMLKLPVPVDDGLDLPAFSEWIERAFSWTKEQEGAGSRILALVEAAEELLPELNLAQRPSVLLHGDLHHMNILRDGKTGWRAIDPKGVIGPQCLEAGRFIQNQMQMVNPAEREQCLDEMTSILARRLGESKRTIAICGFIDCVLGTCWSFQDNAGLGEISESMDYCQVLLEYIRSLP